MTNGYWGQRTNINAEKCPDVFSPQKLVASDTERISSFPRTKTLCCLNSACMLKYWKRQKEFFLLIYTSSPVHLPKACSNFCTLLYTLSPLLQDKNVVWAVYESEKWQHALPGLTHTSSTEGCAVAAVWIWLSLTRLQVLRQCKNGSIFVEWITLSIFLHLWLV